MKNDRDVILLPAATKASEEVVQSSTSSLSHVCDICDICCNGVVNEDFSICSHKLTVREPDRYNALQSERNNVHKIKITAELGTHRQEEGH